MIVRLLPWNLSFLEDALFKGRTMDKFLTNAVTVIAYMGWGPGLKFSRRALV